LLISQPDILLLDEPTNHLDAYSVSWLERFLHEYKGAVIAVTHDRYFLDNVAKWILEVDRGHVYALEGNYTKWLESKERRLAVEEKRVASLERQVKKELEWIRSTPRARQAKGKARVTSYEKTVKEQQTYKTPEAGTIVIPPAPRLGKTVIDIEKLTKSIDGRVLFKDFTYKIPAGAIVGIVGPNGSGKTTLFNIIQGSAQADSGAVKIGETVRLGFVSQTRDALDPDNTVYEEVSQGEENIMANGEVLMNVRRYLSSFNFKAEQQDLKVSSLSGGERNRVHIAKMIRKAPNVLMLDEPTNDLDVEVLRNLENAIQDFTGTAVIISHDRWFLDRVCTHIVAFEGGGKVLCFDGNFQEFEADRARRLGTKATADSKFKKLGV
jgi:ATPase subunit of ABC transporter with duplicated ATPase domains